ncbi:MAG TPA: hypothetical protein VMS17_11310 [Gemmataceae bacterium]|nr:hypothetical protein [Gemmataceae bacterium]
MSVADAAAAPSKLRTPAKPRPPFRPVSFVLGAGGAAALLIGQYYFEAWLIPKLSAVAALAPSLFRVGGVDFTILLVLRLLGNILLLGAAAVAFYRWALRQIPFIYHAPIFITCILAAAQSNYGVLQSFSAQWLDFLTGGWVGTYSPTFATIAVAIGTELVLGRLAYGKWINPASAYVSGISAGILLKTPTNDLWPFALCAMISIASKYALRLRGRHLWNPTNFGVTVILLAAFHHTNPLAADLGNNAWSVILIWSLGALILWKVGKLHIPVVFAAVYILLLPLRCLIAGPGHPWQLEIAPLTSPMYQLYMCFMITDPKTTTQRKWSQCVTVALIAVAEMLFRVSPALYGRAPDWLSSDAAFFALFVVGPAANAIEIYLTPRKAPAPVRAETPALAPALAPIAATPTSAVKS